MATESKPMSEYRQFYIYENTKNKISNIAAHYRKNPYGTLDQEYHVIEYSALTDLQNQVDELKQQNDMNQLIIDGMRGVVAMARAVNNQKPDQRVTHQLKRFDQDKLSDYRDEQVADYENALEYYKQGQCMFIDGSFNTGMANVVLAKYRSKENEPR